VCPALRHNSVVGDERAGILDAAAGCELRHRVGAEQAQRAEADLVGRGAQRPFAAAGSEQRAAGAIVLGSGA